ncbi:MAG: TIGR01620 family protein [Inquilinus sp.]|uniref:TIGR01620 family protein n=1 Tax=Inquilinus sp. TaxID=1932117 RepID=UPI003F38695C
MSRPPLILDQPPEPEREAGRAPAVFALDQAEAVPVEDAPVPAAPDAVDPGLRRRRNPGSVALRIAFGALVGLVGLGIGLWVERLVTDLLSQGGPLQAVTLALLAVAGAGILVWAGWELLALRRLGRVEEIRSLGRAAAGGDAAAADAVIARFRRLHSDGPAADGLARLERERDELRDPAELIALLELHAQRPIDAACRAAIAATARRTALITTVTPFAIVDMVASGALNLRMIRRIAEIQGFRPGLFATLSLIRRVATTLLIAGGIEAANDYLGDFLGAGLLRAFGRRAGEGAINGILSVRIGVAAMKVCRPLPYLRDTPPGTMSLAKAIFGAEAAPKGKD